MSERAISSLPAMAPDKGRLIVVDAIDGAGKDTLARALKETLRLGSKLCNLDAVAKESRPLLYEPGDSEFFEPYDALFVSQPTYVGVGKVIREEIMKKSEYNARSTAQAFSLDRHVLYERTILPFLRARSNRVVIQVRGLMSSLTYQTIQADDEGSRLTVQELLDLPGNALELSRRPDLILLLMVTPETAAKRLQGRTDKQDGDKFVDPRFQARVSLRYRSKEVLEPFKLLGSNIVFIDAEKTQAEVLAECLPHLRYAIGT